MIQYSFNFTNSPLLDTQDNLEFILYIILWIDLFIDKWYLKLQLDRYSFNFRRERKPLEQFQYFSIKPNSELTSDCETIIFLISDFKDFPFGLCRPKTDSFCLWKDFAHLNLIYPIWFYFGIMVSLSISSGKRYFLANFNKLD